jgi:CRISPR/Cas system-associated exonuclease Cas4 (RecB family)
MEAIPTEPEYVTASEVTDYVFCKHSWYLRRRGARVSSTAQVHMDEGVRWQDRKDSIVPVAIERQDGQAAL